MAFTFLLYLLLRLPQYYLPPLLFIIIYKIHSTSTYYYYATLAPTILVPFSESSSQKLNGSLLVLFFARLKIKFNDFPRWNIVDGGELNSQSWVVAQLGIHISLSLSLCLTSVQFYELSHHHV